jgi:LCP family protein required for cell wall assembly
MAWLGTKKGLIVLFLVIFVAMFGIGAVVGEKYKSLFSDSIESKDIKGQAFNILFMGIDDRDNANNSRSDTMILATIDPKTSRVALLSIPRDTRIKNSKGRNEKINGVNYIEGPEAACKAVGELLDTDVEYYVTTNFEGFGKIVDILGGVDINVESDMKHWDVSYAIDLKKGLHHMNGDQALQYVRYRGGPTADIGRTQRQQQFIKALADEMFKAKTILKLPSLIPEINKY